MNTSVYSDLKNFYSTKLEFLLENYKTIGNDYTILGFDKNKAFVLSHKNGAMYLVEGTEKVSRLDLNIDEYETRFKNSVNEFVGAIVEGKPALTSVKRKELMEAFNEQLYLYSLPCDGAIPISEAVRKRVFNCLMENNLFKEYLTKLGIKIKGNKTVLIEAIPYLGLRARDKLIKFFREQIDMTYDQARMAAIALLNLAFGKQYNESFNARNLYKSINTVLPSKKARELTYFVLETAGKAMLNEFKVVPNTSAKVIPVKAQKGDKLIVEPKDEGRIIDNKGTVLKQGSYDVVSADEKGAILTANGAKYEGVVLREAKTYLLEREEEQQNEEPQMDIIEDEEPTMTNEEELQNALSILKRVFKDQVEELSGSDTETFEENEHGFKKLMSSITSLEKYLSDLQEESEIEETKDTTEDEPVEEEIDLEAPEKKELPDVSLDEIVESPEKESTEETSIEDLIKDEKLKKEGQGEEAPPIEEAIGENSDIEDSDVPDFPSEEPEDETPQEAPEFPEEPEDFSEPPVDENAPAYDEGFTEEPKTLTVGDAFIFDSNDDIKDIDGVKLMPEEVYTIVAIDDDKSECALANEKGVKVIVSSDTLKEYNNYFSPVKSLSEGTILEVIDENILDDNDQTVPIGEYELLSLDQEANIAKISNMETNRMFTLDLNNLGNMGVVKTPEAELEQPEEDVVDAEDVDMDVPPEPEKTEYPEEAYDETASEVAQVMDSSTPAPEANITEEGEVKDDKVEITIKIPSDQIEGTKVEDLLFGLTGKKQESGVDDPQENYDKLYGNANPPGQELDEIQSNRIPQQVLNGEDKEVLSLYKQLLSIEDEINSYTDENKGTYQIKEEASKYIALLEKLKEQLASKPTENVKSDVRDFIATLQDEADEVVDESNPAPSINIDEENKSNG